MNTNDLNAAVQVRDIHKRFGTNEVLKGISLQAHKGDVLSIIGASGSGKSTLLRVIAEDTGGRAIEASQRAFAERAVKWDLDTNVNRRMAYNHYFAKAAGKTAPEGSKKS
mgnify:CR=1 FL=1